MLIGITGKIGSGKTTISNYIVEKYGYTEYSMATPLKNIAEIFGFEKHQLYGTQKDKLEINEKWGISARTFLQKIGTELFREKLKDVIPEMKIEKSIWTDIFKKNYDKNKNYVISDVRFLDEAETIKELGGIIIKLERQNLNNLGNTNHISENIEIKADYIIDNNKDISITKKAIDIIINKAIIWWVPFCAGGLGDRILGLSTTFCISQMLKREFLIKWDNSDLSPHLTINPEYNFYNYELAYQQISLDNRNSKLYFEDINLEEEWKDKNVLFWSNQNLFQYTVKNRKNKWWIDNYEKMISDSVRKTINEIFCFTTEIYNITEKESFDIGIHIRTHDNQIYNKNNEEKHKEKIKTQLRTIKQHITENYSESNSIYIASDCLATYEIAKEFFPNFIFTYGPIVHTGTLEEDKLCDTGIQKAIVDLLVLSKKCKKLYIGWHTNFSRISALYDINRDIYCFEYGLQIVDKRKLCDYFSESGTFRM